MLLNSTEGRQSFPTGKSASLLSSHLHVLTGYYEDKIEDYLVIAKPTTGKLRIKGLIESNRVTRFFIMLPETA